MAKNRFQFSDDFILNNGNVGINTAIPQEKLDVVSIIKGDDLKVTGLSSFTTYDGFLNSNQNITETTTISGDKVSGSLSGEIIVGTGVTATVAEEATSSQGNIDSLKVYNTFTVPVGGTDDRPIKVKPGQLYYNKDFKTVEFWDGNVWRQVDNTTRSGRGVYNGGHSAPASTQITYINITTLGNSQYFGDATSSNFALCGGGSDGRRGVFAGGLPNAGFLNTIEYITLASTGNALDFGDLTQGGDSGGCASSSTRALFARPLTRSPATAASNVIDYIQIQTLGNALDFGDLTPDNGASSDGCSSSIRGFFAVGGYPSPYKTIKMVTMSSTGNSIYFGDLVTFRSYAGSVSSTTRGIFAGGGNPSGGPAFLSYNNSIEFITMASQGSGTYFGDLTQGRHSPAGSCTQTRGVFAGGYFAGGVSTNMNTMDYISISSFGNAIDFGDLMYTTSFMSGTSDSHGGLGGF
jgi:hypothetical protein